MSIEIALEDWYGKKHDQDPFERPRLGDNPYEAANNHREHWDGVLPTDPMHWSKESETPIAHRLWRSARRTPKDQYRLSFVVDSTLESPAARPSSLQVTPLQQCVDLRTTMPSTMRMWRYADTLMDH